MAPPPRMQEGSQRRRARLREALQLTANQGPDVAAAQAQAAIVEAGVKRAWTFWQPNVVATGQWDHTSAPSSIPAGSLGPGSPEGIFTATNSRHPTFPVTPPLPTPPRLFPPPTSHKTSYA